MVKKQKRPRFSRMEEKAIYDRDNGTCGICGRPVEFYEFVIDHKIPLSKGGSPKDPDNLQTAHVYCDKIKGAHRTNEQIRKMINFKKIDKKKMNKLVENIMKCQKYKNPDKHKKCIRGALS